MHGLRRQKAQGPSALPRRAATPRANLAPGLPSRAASHPPSKMRVRQTMPGGSSWCLRERQCQERERSLYLRPGWALVFLSHACTPCRPLCLPRGKPGPLGRGRLLGVETGVECGEVSCLRDTDAEIAEKGADVAVDVGFPAAMFVQKVPDVIQ